MARESVPRLRLDVPAEVRLGDPVPIVLLVENPGDRALDLYLRGRTIAFDVTVTRGREGVVIWRRLAGEMIAAILRLETLPPGGTLELRAEWGQRTNDGDPVEPGDYLVRGALLTESPAALETDAVALRIVAR